VASPNFEVATGEFCGAGRAVTAVDIVSKCLLIAVLIL
jgi:hypothetical protein